MTVTQQYGVILFVAFLLQLSIGFTPPTFYCHGRSAARLQQSFQNNVELENEEPLSVLFQRGLVLQRAGNLKQALESYDLFLKAAQQCQVDPHKYAEVHVNVGAIHLRQKQLLQAKRHFALALEHRPMTTAHVNLAVVALQEASVQTDQQMGLNLLKTARSHCLDAIGLDNVDEDPQSVAAARRLLADIDGMMQQSKSQRE